MALHNDNTGHLDGQAPQGGQTQEEPVMTAVESVNLAINALVNAKNRLAEEFAGNPNMEAILAAIDTAAGNIGEAQQLMTGVGEEDQSNVTQAPSVPAPVQG